MFCAETLTAAREQEEQIRAILVGAVAAIRKNNRVKPRAPIIVAIEGCSGDPVFQANVLMHADPDLLVMNEVRGGQRYGVPKDERTVKDMVTIMIAFLSLKLITIPIDAAALSTPLATKRRMMRDYREILMAQFSSFHLVPGSGKMTGKMNGRSDDLVIALIMAIYWMTHFCLSVSDLYARFKQRYDEDIWTSAQPGQIIEEIDNNSAKEISRATKRRRLDRVSSFSVPEEEDDLFNG